MRRGTLEKAKRRDAIGFTLENRSVVRRSTVEEVLAIFKSGDRDVNKAVKMVQDGENGNQANMAQAFEQLSDILCGIGHFSKAMELLEAGQKVCPNSPQMHELIARVAFIMENFDKSIVHNKKAAEMQPKNNCHNHSDIGLAYYRLGIQ
jgi:tetratricopeptide (TPR) repeat protein